jgi:hypothetical protein
MAQCLPWFDRRYIGKAAGEMRERYGAMRLEAFELVEVRNEAPAITEIGAGLRYEEGGDVVERSVEFRLAYEDPAGNYATRGKPGYDWALYRADV